MRQAGALMQCGLSLVHSWLACTGGDSSFHDQDSVGHTSSRQARVVRSPLLAPQLPATTCLLQRGTKEFQLPWHHARSSVTFGSAHDVLDHERVSALLVINSCSCIANGQTATIFVASWPPDRMNNGYGMIHGRCHLVRSKRQWTLSNRNCMCVHIIAIRVHNCGRTLNDNFDFTVGLLNSGPSTRRRFKWQLTC
jgi:hypothetical protein